MSILKELNLIADLCNISVETGRFSSIPPDVYLVITPLVELFEVHADNNPDYEIQEARLSLFSKNSYTSIKNTLVRTLLVADFTIKERRYIEYEDNTGYHHYAIDVAKPYKFQKEKEE
jgi:hypothetical protein